jgi:hypothetical protein
VFRRLKSIEEEDDDQNRVTDKQLVMSNDLIFLIIVSCDDYDTLKSQE